MAWFVIDYAITFNTRLDSGYIKSIAVRLETQELALFENDTRGQSGLRSRALSAISKQEEMEGSAALLRKSRRRVLREFFLLTSAL